jgi:carboxyl-terminal processing protease
MNPKIRKIIVPVFLAAAILASFGLGVWLGKNQVVCKICPPEQIDFSLFWNAWKVIQDKFVSRGELDIQQMIYGAISGMLKSLNDPYTVFLEPSDAKRFIEDVKGTFEGVGMEIGIKKDQLQVVSPLEASPAQKAGLRAGDKILKVNGTSTADMTVDEAVNLIRGPKGTEVTLTIFRDDWKDTKDIKLVRAIIDVPSLKWELKEDDIAYIKLYQFSENASPDFRKAVIEILASPARRIVLDLRNNPGGYLEVAQDIAGWFLENGQTVTIEDFGGKQKQEIYKAQGSANLLPYPTVILINRGSASASEILSGALRDNRGIKLIGETSFGKGSVQEMENLQGGSSLKVTIARWLTPKGESISEKGLDPDIKVEITDKDYQDGKDPQLEKALEIIKNLE